ncbi:hypothetical protein D9M72_643240 [compost metagenome]
MHTRKAVNGHSFIRRIDGQLNNRTIKGETPAIDAVGKRCHHEASRLQTRFRCGQRLKQSNPSTVRVMPLSGQQCCAMLRVDPQPIIMSVKFKHHWLNPHANSHGP